MRQHASKAIKRPRLRRQRPIRSRRHHRHLPPQQVSSAEHARVIQNHLFHLFPRRFIVLLQMKTSEATPTARTNHTHVKPSYRPSISVRCTSATRSRRKPRFVRAGHSSPRSTASANIPDHSINRCISGTKISFNVRATLVPSGNPSLMRQLVAEAFECSAAGNG